MSNYRAIRAVISQISGQENILVVPKLFIKLTGDLTTAILLNQILFYSDKSKRADGYFYKTYKEWESEICLTKRQVSYSAEKLKKIGFIETKTKKANGAPTVHYKLDYDKLLQTIVTICDDELIQNVTLESSKVSQTIESNKMSLSLTEKENTTENTTESIPYAEIIKYLNEQASKSFNPKTEGHKKHIRARWNEGYTLENFKTVIDKKVEQWKDAVGKDGKPLSDYLRPSTLFSQKHFDNYLNESVKRGTNNAKVGAKDSFIDQYDF